MKGQKVMVYEKLGPPTADLDYMLTAAVVDPRERRRFSVAIETDAYAREKGTGYLVGVTYPGQHVGGMGAYAVMPTWAQWKPKAIALIEAELAKKP